MFSTCLTPAFVDGAACTKSPPETVATATQAVHSVAVTETAYVMASRRSKVTPFCHRFAMTRRTPWLGLDFGQIGYHLRLCTRTTVCHPVEGRRHIVIDAMCYSMV